MQILEYFPGKIGQVIKNNLNNNESNILEEIRIRVNKPIILKLRNNNKVLDYIINTQDILEIMEKITDNLI